MPTNGELAAMFETIAALLEVKGENPFKTRAYARAAESIIEYPEPLAPLSESDLQAIPGIGEAIAAKIAERVRTGRLGFLERLEAEIPATALELVRIPGIGAKTAGKLIGAGVVSRSDLESALRSGAVINLLGAKAAEKIRRGLTAIEPQSTRFDLERATAAASVAVPLIRRLTGIQRVEIAGSLRRLAERVGDVNLAVAVDDLEQARDRLQAFVPEAIPFSPFGLRFPINQVMISVRLAPVEAFGSLWQWWTGSAEHNQRLVEVASARGLGEGPFGLAGAGSPGFATEEALYEALGLMLPPPEIREGRDELEAARNRTIPELLTVGDLRGDLHVHTDQSDGTEPLAVMVEAARARGYEYLAITDHSVGRAVANGLDIARLKEQIRRIQDYNERNPDGPLVLTGSEVDIRADGSLDYPDEVLAELDVVIASVHSALDQPREKMTARLVTAARHPHVTAIGHPTGRLIGRRDPSDVDIEMVLMAAAESGTWVEINAHPARLDLKDDHVRLARALGVGLVINTDAHHPSHFDLAQFGVGVARRAWTRAGDVVNTLPRESFLARLAAKRGNR